MATFTRSNAWNNGGTFSNTDLLWYAKAVGAMQARALNATSSWWFFAAMHGQYVADNSFPGWGFLPAPPSVPTTPQPPGSVSGLYWDQCQHQSWYFPPWHRGYLLALEAQIRADVVNLGGPSSWALPYWNYFGPGNQFSIPPAFTQKTLPDGSSNPLFVTARYGPDGDGNIYVPTPSGVQQHPNDPNLAPGTVTQECMANDRYTGSDANTPPPGFGGPTTGFSHQGGTSGNLENNPHNLVHIYVGGNAPDGQTYGLMSDPGIAALDPIFYLHHANIDRMWALWNLNPANTNPTDPTWLNGPAAAGGREFVMPNPDGSSLVYTPQQMNSLAQLNYTYDDLSQVIPAPPTGLVAVTERLTKLGATSAAKKVKEGVLVTAGKNRELVGATQEAIPINSRGAQASVKLDAVARRKVSASLAKASETALPDRVFLNLENIQGTHDAAALSVYINLPDGAKPSDHPELLAGTVGLFGLRSASLKDGKHAGQGLNFILDITKIVDALHLQNAFDADSLKVALVPRRALPDQAKITVGRISVYREGN
jgi:tyrosinase